MTTKLKRIAGFFALLLLLAACKKDKFDFENDNRPVTENRKKSNVRIVNLSDYNQVVANGDTLTNFIVRHPSSLDADKLPGTSYFPTNGILGKIWDMPMDLFDAKEKAALTIAARYYQGYNSTIELDVENNYNNPTDYFLLPFNYFKGQPQVVPVTRGVTAPSKADHFKIRIINLTGQITNPVFTVNGPQENLQGPVTLAFADGTPVSAKTSHITAASVVSEYVEVPYGTYQFKVLTDDGRQYASTPSTSTDHSYTMIEPSTSALPVNFRTSSNLTYAPINVYQPGGIYTVIVVPQRFNYLINENDEESFTYQNSVRIISDNSPAANITYCRMQGVNALTEQAITIRANGKEFATGLTFAQAGGYSQLVNGTYKLEAVDAKGTVIASTEQLLRAAQNYTAWLHPAADGSSKLLIVANDLSGTSYLGSSEDATNDWRRSDFFFFRRFLNLSPDNPYITFTLGNGQPAATGIQASVNLQPGIPFMEQPYVKMGYVTAGYEVMAYRSSPNVVPGTWADDVPVLSSQDFIADKALYTNVNRALPMHEPGVFTVALIGRTGSAAPKAKMMILKHNK